MGGPRRVIATDRLEGFEAMGYAELTFPVLQCLLAPVVPGSDGRILVGARAGDEPAGLAVALPRRDGSVELLSLHVRPAARRRGLGGALVERLEEEARRDGRVRLVCRLERGRRGNDDLERLLLGRGWIVARSLGMLCRIDERYGDLKRAAWLAAAAPRRGEEILPWTPDFRRETTAAGAVPEELDPADDDSILDARESLLLRTNGAWAGWLLAHRPGARVLRYTSLHVEPGLAAPGAGARLVAEAIRRHAIVPGERASFLASASFPRMVAFARRRIAPWCAEANDLVELARAIDA